MKANHGGKATKMKPSLLTEACIGPHPCILKEGDTQEFIQTSDPDEGDGPFYYKTMQQKQQRRFDVDQPVTKEVFKALNELQQELSANGVSFDVNIKLKAAKVLAKEHDIESRGTMDSVATQRRDGSSLVHDCIRSIYVTNCFLFQGCDDP